VLHVHCREADGHGSKRLSMFNEMLARLREAVPGMLLQVGGSISFAPEGEGGDAKWLNDDTRHMLAELKRFFLDYKTLEKKQVEIETLRGRVDAENVIDEALAYYRRERDKLRATSIR